MHFAWTHIKYAAMWILSNAPCQIVALCSLLHCGIFSINCIHFHAHIHLIYIYKVAFKAHLPHPCGDLPAFIQIPGAQYSLDWLLVFKWISIFFHTIILFQCILPIFFLCLFFSSCILCHQFCTRISNVLQVF